MDVSSFVVPPHLDAARVDAGHDASARDATRQLDTGVEAQDAGSADGAVVDSAGDVVAVEAEASSPPPLGAIGDPCTAGDTCASGTCSPGGWCTKTCATLSDCGDSSAGVANVCEEDPSNALSCFPICSAQSGCDIFSGEATTCSGVGQMYCQYPVACSMTGASCTSTSTCCSGLTCLSGKCGTCGASGATCGSGASSCCSGLTCLSSEKCGACSSTGGSCERASDCCNGEGCFSQKCATCGAKWESCVSGSSCCSGLTCPTLGGQCEPAPHAAATATVTAPTGAGGGGGLGDSSDGSGAPWNYRDCGSAAPAEGYSASCEGGVDAAPDTYLCLSVSGKSGSLCSMPCSTDADCAPRGSGGLNDAAHCIAFGTQGYCLGNCTAGELGTFSCYDNASSVKCKSMNKLGGGTADVCSAW